MSKKKILTLAIAVIVVVMAVSGATLAYLKDTDKADNVFTTGNVDIELIENFGDNDPETPEKLIPVIPDKETDSGYKEDEYEQIINSVTKEVYVKNQGTEKSYVRVHIAVPTVLVNSGHFHIGWTDDENWSVAETTYIMEMGDDDDAIGYTVYVATYALEMNPPTKNGSLTNYDYTTAAMGYVYVDEATTNADLAAITEALGTEWHILVVAEGCQSAGFDSASDALNTAFGDPTADGYTAPDFSGAAKA